MLARIIKIATNKTVIQNEDGEIYNVQKTELDFKYKLGDKIEMIQNGKDYYFLPFNIDDNFELNQKPTIPIRKPSYEPNGLGGWLLYYIITHIIRSLITIGIVAWAFLTNDGYLCTYYNLTINECNLLTRMLLGGTVITFIIEGIHLMTILVLSQSKKHNAIGPTMAILLGKCLFYGYALFDDAPITISTVIFLFLLTDSIVWSIYFSTSKRVKNTYIN